MTDPPFCVGFKGKRTKHTLPGGGYASGEDDGMVGPQVVGAGTGTSYSDAGLNPYVPGGISTQEPSTVSSRFTPKAAAIGLGGLAVLGGIAWLVMRRKRQQKTPSRSFPFGA